MNHGLYQTIKRRFRTDFIYSRVGEPFHAMDTELRPFAIMFLDALYVGPASKRFSSGREKVILSPGKSPVTGQWPGVGEQKLVGVGRLCQRDWKHLC